MEERIKEPTTQTAEDVCHGSGGVPTGGSLSTSAALSFYRKRGFSGGCSFFSRRCACIHGCYRTRWSGVDYTSFTQAQKSHRGKNAKNQDCLLQRMGCHLHPMAAHPKSSHQIQKVIFHIKRNLRSNPVPSDHRKSTASVLKYYGALASD